MNASANQVEPAIEDVRPGYQNHAGADRNKTQRRAQLIMNGDRTNESGEKRRAEWLNEYVGTQSRNKSAQYRSDSRTYEDNCRGSKMRNTEYHGQREEPGWSWWSG